MRFARRKDRTHSAIRRVFEQAHCAVLDVAGLGDLGCDLVVWLPNGTAYVIEVKDGDLSPSKRSLTDSEVRLMLRMPRHYRVIGSCEEAARLIAGTALAQERRSDAPRQSGIPGSASAAQEGV